MLFQNLSFLVDLNLDCVDLSAHSSSWCEAISHALPNLKDIASSLSTAPKAAHHRCRDDQRSAFAQLQENLKFPVSSSKAELWDVKTDCCSWEGVTCNDVGHATRLDLSFAYYEYGDSISLKKPNLGMLFQNLISFLVELNLDYVNISAQGSNWCEVISHVLPNLRVLSLSGSGLSVFQTTVLDLSENLLLSGQFPEFSLNSSIQYLSLKNTNFSGNIPLSISNLKSLNYLDLSRCKFYGVIPPSLANLTQLETLDLSFNSFNGSIPPFQRDGVANPSFLSLEHNQLNGILYSSLFTLPSLQNLDLSSNQLTGQLDEFSDASSSLLIIELSNNNLSGSIPRSIFKLPSLIELNLLHNKFSGPLKLDLSNNRIQGYVPSWIWKKTLTTLYLSRNPVDFPKIPPFSSFHGEIPEEIRILKSLIVLNLSHNNFLGQIPSSLSDLTELESLDLSSNHLSGEIPPQLSRLTFLAVMNLSYNHLEGRIPQGNQFLTFPNSSYEGNPRLCGPPLTRKCNPEVNEPATPPADHEDSWTEYILDWKIVGIGYASGIVIGFSVGYTILSCKSLMHHIDEEWSVILSFKLMFKFTVPEELAKLKTRFMSFSL
ncbi:hypothetical protein BDE02_11G016200 [Populus trichocarpa]|nr:hypothetical protein BDE02_11G016200 [Populus trichocarpa]